MITKIHASILYGYGYSLVDNEGNVYSIMSIGDFGAYLRGSNPHKGIDIKFSEIGSTYRILCRPIEDLTKEIEGIGIPIVELKNMLHSISISSAVKVDFHNLDTPTLYGLNEDGGEVSIPYEIYCKLFEWHFNLDFPSGTTQNLI